MEVLLVRVIEYIFDGFETVLIVAFARNRDTLVFHGKEVSSPLVQSLGQQSHFSQFQSLKDLVQFFVGSHQPSQLRTVSLLLLFFTNDRIFDGLEVGGQIQLQVYFGDEFFEERELESNFVLDLGDGVLFENAVVFEVENSFRPRLPVFQLIQFLAQSLIASLLLLHYFLLQLKKSF